MAESYSPPEGVRAAAKRALKWIEEGKAGANFTDVGRKRASDLARGADISVDTIKRMKSFFARHEVDKKATGFSAGEEGYPSPGRVAWDAWGGDAGQSWANSIVDEESSNDSNDDDRKERAQPNELVEGDFVMWNANARVSYGRVMYVMTQGRLGFADSLYSLESSPENPAALVQTYVNNGLNWEETPDLTGQRVLDLLKIDSLKSMSQRSEESLMSTNNWKITIPVDRAEETSDGLFIYGQASGPERDSHGTEMDTTAIEDFAKQIEERASAGDPIPYLDHHQKDGVLRELGTVVSGSVDNDYRLNVAVRLDEENPAARYLHSRIKRGKQYGMSIAGDGVQYKMLRDETTGEQVIRFLRIALKEISNTTRPSWVPSFGTVLARSIEGEENGEVMAEELVKADAPAEQVENVAAESAAPVVADVVEEQAPVEAAAVEDAPVVENAQVEEAPVADAPVEAEVERARIAKKDAKAFMAALKALHEQVAALGITEDEETVAETVEATPVEATAPEDNVDFNGVAINRDLADAITAFVTSKVDESTAVLRETVEKQADYIKALEEMPAGKVPAALVRGKFESDEIDLGSLTPEDRLRYALKNLYNK
jgi:phage head maturation protease